MLHHSVQNHGSSLLHSAATLELAKKQMQDPIAWYIQNFHAAIIASYHTLHLIGQKIPICNHHADLPAEFSPWTM